MSWKGKATIAHMAGPSKGLELRLRSRKWATKGIATNGQERATKRYLFIRCSDGV